VSYFFFYRVEKSDTKIFLKLGPPHLAYHEYHTSVALLCVSLLTFVIFGWCLISFSIGLRNRTPTFLLQTRPLFSPPPTLGHPPSLTTRL